jgi:hypothetical protein
MEQLQAVRFHRSGDPIDVLQIDMIVVSLAQCP